MVKRALPILIGIIVLAILFITFTGQKINEVTNIKYANVTKIVFVDGRGGRNKPLTIEDKENIKEFMSYIDSYVVKKVENPEPRTGWIHSAVFYENDKEIMNITFVNPIIINGEYYRVIRGGLNTTKIDKFLKSINPSWDM
ncbi:hypothetical protein [Clostridium sp.]